MSIGVRIFMRHICGAAVIAIATLALALALRPAAAAYPERNVTIVCASGAGGIVDVTTRIIADHMSRTLGRTVVVQNEAGAGSTLAIAIVAKAAPDGYTVLTIGPGVGVVHELYPTAKVDVVRDLQPVSIMGVAPMVLLTHKDVPVTDYASLLAYIKAHPGELTTGSNGRGSAGHLASALFRKMAGVDIRYIPYRTTPQAQADLIGGRLSMMWLSTLTDHIQAGTLRPIAVSTLARWKLFPMCRPSTNSGSRATRRRPGSACTCRRARRQKRSTSSTPRWSPRSRIRRCASASIRSA